MKKFFGMLLAAVSALVLLPGCGGGGDGDNIYTMSGEDFKNGRKHFILGGGGVGTLYIAPAYGGTYLPGTEEVDPNTGVIVKQVVQSVGTGAKAQVAVVNNPGASLALSLCKYEVYYDPDTGLPITAKLYINYDGPVNNDNNTTTFFDRAQADANGAGGENQLRILFDLNFSDYTWTLTENGGAAPENPDDAQAPRSGDFAVGLGNNPAAVYRNF